MTKRLNYYSGRYGETTTLLGDILKKLSSNEVGGNRYVSGTTSAIGDAELALRNRANTKENERLRRFAEKATSVVNEIKTLPQEELDELERTEGFNVNSVLRSLLLGLDDLEHNEADLDNKLADIRKYISRIRPKLVGNVSKKQKIMSQTAKQAIKLKMLREEVTRFQGKLKSSRTFNDGIFGVIVNFERNIAMPYLDVSLVNSIISAYYVYTANPRIVELQQLVSQMFVVYSQTAVLGNKLLVPTVRPPNPQHSSTILDNAGAGIDLVDVSASYPRMRTSEFDCLVEGVSAGLQVPGANTAALQIMSVPYLISSNYLNTTNNFIPNISTTSNQQNAFETNILTITGANGMWPNFIRLAQYADDKVVQRAAFAKKTTQERVVAVLASAVKENTQLYGSIFSTIQDAYRKKSPNLLRKILAYNSNSTHFEKLSLTGPALMLFMNNDMLAQLPANGFADKIWTSNAATNATGKFLNELDNDNRGAGNNLNRSRIVIALFSNAVTALEFIPILMEYIVPVKLVATRAHMSTKILESVPQFQALRNALIKAFWIYVNKNGVDTLYTLLDFVISGLTHMQMVVRTSVSMLMSTYNGNGMMLSEFNITPIKKACEELIVVFLTGKAGRLDTAIRGLNPNAHDYSLEEAEQEADIETASSHDLDIF